MPSLSAKELTTDLLIRYGFQILGALAILGVGLILARYVGNLTGRWLERRALEPPVRSLMVKTVRVVVLIFTLVVALDKFGFQVAPLGVYGQVSSIELFATTLLHPDQSRVIIPNRKIVGEILHNHGTTRQVDLTVGVSYATDLPKALAAARETLLANPRVLKAPAPIVGIASLGDSAITLALGPRVAVPDYALAQGELYQAVVERFKAAGIEMPFPQREVRLLGAA
jgi:small conductance mechanosensitive channel